MINTYFPTEKMKTIIYTVQDLINNKHISNFGRFLPCSVNNI